MIMQRKPAWKSSFTFWGSMVLASITVLSGCGESNEFSNGSVQRQSPPIETEPEAEPTESANESAEAIAEQPTPPSNSSNSAVGLPEQVDPIGSVVQPTPQSKTFSLSQITPEVITIKKLLNPLHPDKALSLSQNHQKLDLLVVIDNSGSMIEEQKNLKSKLEPLIDDIKDIDWQIAVVTTNNDVDQDCFRGLIRRDTADGSQAFADAISAGTKATGDEMGFRNAITGLKGLCPKQTSWLRNDSFVSVLIVSDEDNCSHGACADKVDWREKFDEFMEALRPDPSHRRIYGIVADETSKCKDYGSIGSTYIDVIKKSRGQVGDICQGNYTKTLKAISSDLAAMLKREVSFAEKPQADSINIKVKGKPWKGFSYDKAKNKVIFSEIPPANADIEVLYKSDAPSPDEFNYRFAKKPVKKSIRVHLEEQELMMDQLELDASEEGYNLRTTLELATPKELTLTYEEETLPRKTFFIDSGLKISRVDVKLKLAKESYQAAFTYDESSGAITLEQPPELGAQFELIVTPTP